MKTCDLIADPAALNGRGAVGCDRWIQECPRCSKAHKGLFTVVFDHTLTTDDGDRFEAWSLCPESARPILWFEKAYRPNPFLKDIRDEIKLQMDREFLGGLEITTKVGGS